MLEEESVDVSVTNEEGNNCLVEAILNGHRSNKIITAVKNAS